ncbi:histidine kinase [Kineosporia sp. NBRC 101731]|uniref:sensor histidine kinase n=1 Tax=Kineosporia sp. NBRC 101731 TaxID=3032199 RepID=UPI0024A3C38C|nr:histidine kinase [Kineosporia sp. NBRC 101731]GLY29807.1 two-component sensor histidine kinase [Kineosporia sp. NBRC 101731]
MLSTWWAELSRPVTPLRGRGRRSWALDGLLAGLVAVLSVDSVNLLSLTIVLVVAPLLLVRRIWPVPVNLLVILIAVSTFGTGNLMLQFGAVAVALHTLTVLGPRPVAVTGLVLSMIWPVVATLGPMSALNSVAQKVLIFIGLSTPQILAFTLGVYRRDRDQRHADLQARNRLLEIEREQRDALAAADERARIAREMHDLIAHHLTVVVALSEGLARSGEITSDRSRQAVTTTVAMARAALEETRQLLGMMPREKDLGGARQPVPDLRSITGLVSQVRAAGLPVTLETEGEPWPDGASSGLQLTIYRLVQEALTNCMKHAQDVTRAVVRLRYRPDALAISIEDDGRTVGASQTDGLGRGVLGMRQRVQSFGGTVEAGPGASGGWMVSAQFPLNHQVDQ